MAVTTKKLFPATSNATTTVFSPVGIQLNNQDDLDVYVTLSGGTRVLQLRQSTGSTAQSSHPQVNNTDGLYFPAVTAGTTLYNYQLSTDNNTITFNSALPQGAVVFCERRTRDADSSYTTFASGSTIRATDLNNSSTESNFTAQDGRNKALEIEGVLFRGDQPSTNYVTTDHIVNDSVTADKIPDDTINSEHYVASSIDLEHMSANSVDSDQYVDGSIDEVHISNSAVTQNKLADNSVGTPEIINGSVTDAKIATGTLDNRYFTETELDPSASTGANVLDARYYTETEADARFYNVASTEEIQSGETWVAADNKVATTAAIDARIIDLVDDVGGFHPIPNETSFPSVNVDVNNGAGTLISIKEIATARTPSSGVVTIANGAGSSTVTITGCGSTILAAGFGAIVETTSTLHTYAFHRLQPKATEVTTVAGSIANVNITAGSIGNVDIVGPDIDNVNTVAGSIGNVNTVAGSISSVNNASTNISSINNFGDLYQVNSSNPSTDGGGASLSAGDLYFNTSADRLKVYNGTDWVDGVIASGGGAQTSGDTFTGDIKINDDVKLLVGTHSDLQIYHTGSHSIIAETGTGILYLGGNQVQLYGSGTNDILLKAVENGAVELYYDNSKKFETTSNGATVTGDLTFSDSTANDIHLRGGKIYGDDSAINTLEIRSTSGNANHARIAIGEVTNNDNGGIVFYGAGSSSADVKLTIRGTADTVEIPDNHKFVCGDDQDLEIYHDGSNSYLDNTGTGDFYIRGNNVNSIILRPKQDENSIIAKSNGAVELYYNNSKKFETQNNGTRIYDSLGIGVDSTSDTSISIRTPDGTSGSPSTKTGLSIREGAFSDGNLIEFQNSVGNVDIKVDGSLNLKIADDHKIRLGNNNELDIYVDEASGTRHSYMMHSGNGVFKLGSDTSLLLGKTTAEAYLKAVADGAVELYHDNLKKFETTSIGCKITDAGANTALQFANDNGANGYVFANSTDEIGFKDSATHWLLKTIKDGAVELYHDNSKTAWTHGSGFNIKGGNTSDLTELIITGNEGQAASILMSADDGDDNADHWRMYSNADNSFTLRNYTAGSYETNIKAIGNAGVELYYDNTKKLETTNYGTKITGTSIRLNDDSAITGTPHIFNYTRGAGATSALSLYGAESALELVSTDDGTHGSSLLIRTAVDGAGFVYNPTDNALELKTFSTSQDNFNIHNNGAHTDQDLQFRVVKDGAVELYHNGTKKLETTSTGATVTGTLQADSYGDIKLADPFIEMAQTITTSRTISNNYNAFTVGPVTINTGVTVTVGDGENWVIV